jgi:hypothetical protein
VVERALTEWARNVWQHKSDQGGSCPWRAGSAESRDYALQELKEDCGRKADGNMTYDKAWDMNSLSHVVEKMLAAPHGKFAQVDAIDIRTRQELRDTLWHTVAQTRHRVAHDGIGVQSMLVGMRAVDKMLCQLLELPDVALRAMLSESSNEAMASGANCIHDRTQYLEGVLRDDVGHGNAPLTMQDGEFMRMLLRRGMMIFHERVAPMIVGLLAADAKASAAKCKDKQGKEIDPRRDAGELCKFIELSKEMKTVFKARGLTSGIAKNVYLCQRNDRSISQGRNALHHRVGSAFTRDEVCCWLIAIENVMRAFGRSDVKNMSESVKLHAERCIGGANDLRLAIDHIGSSRAQLFGHVASAEQGLHTAVCTVMTRAGVTELPKCKAIGEVAPFLKKMVLAGRKKKKLAAEEEKTEWDRCEQSMLDALKVLDDPYFISDDVDAGKVSAMIGRVAAVLGAFETAAANATVAVAAGAPDDKRGKVFDQHDVEIFDVMLEVLVGLSDAEAGPAREVCEAGCESMVVQVQVQPASEAERGSAHYIAQSCPKNIVGEQHRKIVKDVSAALRNGTERHVLWGWPGTGKTVAAQAIVHELQKQPPCKKQYWMKGGSAATFKAALVAFGRSFVEAVRFDTKPEDALREVREFVTEQGQDWLFVIDDAESAELVTEFLPDGTCSVLMTARSSLGLLNAQKIPVFKLEESIEMLHVGMGLAGGLSGAAERTREADFREGEGACSPGRLSGKGPLLPAAVGGAARARFAAERQARR